VVGFAGPLGIVDIVAESTSWVCVGVEVVEDWVLFWNLCIGGL